MMDARQWELVKRLFQAALDRPDTERATFVRADDDMKATGVPTSLELPARQRSVLEQERPRQQERCRVLTP